MAFLDRLFSGAIVGAIIALALALGGMAFTGAAFSRVFLTCWPWCAAVVFAFHPYLFRDKGHAHARGSTKNVPEWGPKKIADFENSMDASSLINVLRDATPADRVSAREALVRIGPRDYHIVEMLLSGLKDDSDNVRLNAAMILAEIGDGRVVSSLTDALDDKSWIVVGYVSRALFKLGSRKGIAPSIGLLTSSKHNWFVKEFAAQVLGDIGDESAIPSLTAACQDSNERVKRAAEDAINKIRQSDGTAISHANPIEAVSN